jgi:transposase
MNSSPLFPLPEAQAPQAPLPTRPEHARLRRPDRHQVRLEPRDLDSLLPLDHLARSIWDFVERLDLRVFYASIKAVLDGPGRPATDPQVLLALWVLANSEDVGSARQLARLCEEHDAYRWLRGGVPINYHMLADFRAARANELDELLSQIIAILKAAGLVPLDQVAQDGLRVRASAGSSSFRNEETLEGHLEEARAQVKRLAAAREHPDQGVSRRKLSAQERAARERQERLEKAVSLVPEMEAIKERQRKTRGVAREKVGQARVSSTDPEARIMRMPDGGFRPAYNAQFATDVGSLVIVGVGVTNNGSDGGQALPMAEQVEERAGQRPKAYLMDGAFISRSDITTLEQRGTQVYAPLRLKRTQPGEESSQAREGDSPEVVAWRQRMATEDGKALYRNRAATAEWTNAQVRQHGLSQLNLRGIAKVTSALLLVAVTHDILRWLTLSTS